MTSSTFINLRVNNAEQFKEASAEPTPNTKIYLTYGKIFEWANDAAPPTTNTSMSTVYEVWKNMIGAKSITSADVSHVIPRNNWSANTVYIAYDHKNTDLHNTNSAFYCVNSAYNVYKCIANNNSANSTTEPTSINPNIFTETADGYVWKYMYPISLADRLRFTTSDYIPVKNILTNDGSTQWLVQNTAIDGAVQSIKVSAAGSGYTNTDNVIITFGGDGSSLTASVNVNVTSQTVNSIIITNPGTGYTNAIGTITGGSGSGATAEAIISPPGGHGSNPLYELGGKDLLLNPRLINSEEDILPTTNDFRQIAIIKDPYTRGTTTVSSNVAITQVLTITTIGVGDYDQDEIVYQGTSLAAATFSGQVVSWDSTNGVIKLINTEGTSSSDPLVGSNTAVSRFLSQTTEGDLKKYSGQLLYVDNIKPITRSAEQTEDFKIVIKF
jgi:hypothetical protein